MKFWWLRYAKELSTEMLLQKYQQYKDTPAGKTILRYLANRIPDAK